MSHPLVWTIPAGQPFARLLARELLRRARPSADLADTTILVPTARAGRTVTRALAEEARPGALLLPRITPLGEVGEDEAVPDRDDRDAVSGPAAGDLRPAIGRVHRQLLLTRLVAGMRRERVGGTLAEAVRLARELAALLDTLQYQERALSELETLVDEDLAEHWQETLRFLDILRNHWPKVLAEAGYMDPAARRAHLLRRQAEAWRRHPPPGPVLAAGSTGSIPAARAVIAVVAGLPRGEVVLAGLDRTVDAASWEALDESHPQFGLKRLLEALDVDRSAVRTWPGSEPSARARARSRLLAEVMRPAATADRWPETVPHLDVDAGLDGLQVAEARDSIEEAGTVAVLLRETLETPGKTAALVTNDRELAARVRATLRRWRIEVDDSGGEPLSDTSVAVLVRLAARAAAGNGRPVDLLALFKHPLVRGGGPRSAFLSRVRTFERRVARRLFAWNGLPDARAELRRQVQDRPDLAELAAWLDAFDARIAPFRRKLGTTAEAGDLVAAHRGFAEWLAAPGPGETGSLYDGHAGEQFRAFLDEFEAGARTLGPVRGRDYPGLLDEVLAGVPLYPRAGAHPRLRILGTLEARLVSADRVIAGGLVEGSWPRRTAPNPWLSRTMQASLGLLTDAHRTGMGAQDFVHAASVPEACLCFAHKSRGTPTVRSRWLTRLQTVLRTARRTPAPPEALGLWHRLTAPPAYRPRSRPQFAPPLATRPRRLSVTQVRTLLREPYAVYARHVLGLRALDRPGRRPGPAEFGTAVHAVLERLACEGPGAGRAADPDAWIRALSREALERFRTAEGGDARWWEHRTWSHRLEAILRWFLRRELLRAARGDAVWAEVSGACGFDDPPFTLVARADRIEVDAETGYAAVLDYKTGTVPTRKDVQSGRDPQLALAGVLAEAGGFPDLPAGLTVDRLAYWRVTGRGEGGEVRLELARPDTTAAMQAARGRLEALVRRHGDPGTAYAATHDPEPHSDYAVLARTHEWTLAGLRDPDE